LTQSLEGTQRIIGIAEAARTSFSAHPAALEVITTRLEAYAFLGVNASASETALKKAVNALRQCWHPDLATDEEDRRLREIRIKQINMAWDLISRKQMSAC
jgi:DnaJ-class molecular chaperone